LQSRSFGRRQLAILKPAEEAAAQFPKIQSTLKQTVSHMGEISQVKWAFAPLQIMFVQNDAKVPLQTRQ
jgi:hypothetical protein